MKTDIYTKVVLTIIAICTVIIVFRNIDLIEKSFAEPKTDLNSITDYQAVQKVEIYYYNGVKNVPLYDRNGQSPK